MAINRKKGHDINNKAAHPRKEDRGRCLCIVKEGGGAGIVELNTLSVTDRKSVV